MPDVDLQGCRDSILYPLSTHWVLVGWELQTAHTVSEVAVALQPLKDTWRIGRFLKLDRHRKRFSKRLLDQARDQSSALVFELRRAYDEQRQQNDSLQLLNNALQQASGPQKRRFQQELVKEQRKARHLQAWYEKCQKLVSRLSKKVEGLEGGLFCQEILALVKERRYALTPRNVAHAMAGLPEMGYRRSITRCLHLPPGLGDSLDYQLFSMVEKIARQHASRKGLLPTLRSGILRLSKQKQDSALKSDFCENWLFFKEAVQEATVRPVNPRQLPYLICGKYLRKRMESRSPVREALRIRNRIV